MPEPTGELLRRDPRNPILTARDLPHMEEGVFNPGAVAFRGETLLMVRVEDRRGISRLAVARSRDGVSDWRIDECPDLSPQPETHPEETLGIEDPRITYLEALGQYAITYTAYSEFGPLVSLMLTTDFERFERVGPLLPPENKDAALFPVQFNGYWTILHRPVPRMGDDRAHIWLGSSPDLRHWGGHHTLLASRRGRPHWDSGRIGLSPPPMATDGGWLLMYHSTRSSVGGKSYRLGLALLDLDDPTRVLCRSNEWLFSPDASYERVGQGGVVFPCGWIRDGDDLRVYYGAGDRTVALAHARLSELLDWLERHNEP